MEQKKGGKTNKAKRLAILSITAIISIISVFTGAKMKIVSFLNLISTREKKIPAHKWTPRVLNARLAGSHCLLKERTFFLGRLQQALE
jgi:hypothetical protein